MKTNKYKNIAFIFVASVIVFSIMLFNFFMDPYNVFKNKTDMDFYGIPRNYAHILLKAYRNITCDTIVIGSSNVNTLFKFDNFFSHFFNRICINSTSYKEQYVLLKDYLHFHPETKNAYIILCYPVFLNHKGEPISKLEGEKLNLKELAFLFFSKETTQRSITKFKYRKYYKETFDKNNIYYYPENIKFEFEYYPNTIPDLRISKEMQQKLKNENIEYFKKIINLLKEKNINYTIIIPSYHAIYQSMIFEIPYMKETIEGLKRLCVKMSENDVYDFSVVNKYTTHDIINNNYLYVDLVHPNYVMGLKIFKVFHDNISERDMYVKLNKRNIEQQIKYQNKLISDYDKNNKDTVSKYMNFYENNPDVDKEYFEWKNFNNAPDYVTQELDSYQKSFKNFNLIHHQGKRIKKGYFKNKIWF